MHELNGNESNCTKEYNYSGLIFHALYFTLIFQERSTKLHWERLELAKNIAVEFRACLSLILNLSPAYSVLDRNENLPSKNSLYSITKYFYYTHNRQS